MIEGSICGCRVTFTGLDFSKPYTWIWRCERVKELVLEYANGSWHLCQQSVACCPGQYLSIEVIMSSWSDSPRHCCPPWYLFVQGFRDKVSCPKNFVNHKPVGLKLAQYKFTRYCLDCNKYVFTTFNFQQCPGNNRNSLVALQNQNFKYYTVTTIWIPFPWNLALLLGFHPSHCCPSKMFLKIKEMCWSVFLYVFDQYLVEAVVIF